MKRLALLALAVLTIGLMAGAATANAPAGTKTGATAASKPSPEARAAAMATNPSPMLALPESTTVTRPPNRSAAKTASWNAVKGTPIRSPS